MKNKFIKNNWLKISIILFTCFIIIPIVLNVFKIHEGIDDTIVDGTTIDGTNAGTTIDGTNNIGTTIDATNNVTPSDFDINTNNINTNILGMEFINPLVENGNSLLLTDPRQQINRNLRRVFNINNDLSNNVYRKSDSVTDLYDTSGNNMLNNILSKLSGLSTKIDDMKKEETPIENIKCIADFGTNIGDNLCCGQSGVLTDTKYVCPENYSKCDNMKCGSKYGTCVKP